MNTKMPYRSKKEVDVFSVLANPVGMSLFRYIASNGGWGRDDLITTLKCSKKQFYMNMHRLIELGIVKREKTKYMLSSYGKVVNNTLKILDGSIKYKDPLILLEENRSKYTPQVWEKMAEMLIPNPSIRQLAFQ